MADARLHLLHLSSPALPIGAYAYSQGLEYAIEAGWVEGSALRDWLADGLQLGLAGLEVPVLLRALAAAGAGDTAALASWNDLILANRETRELLLEDQQIGAALWRLLRALLPPPLPELGQAPAYAIAFAWACHGWRISAEDACAAFCYSWLENQVTAATKLVPLGQTAAQTLLLELLDAVPAAVATARSIEDKDIGVSLPGLALASCRHEFQHTRLFRS
ncbi:MAG: urease accessory UreF family protein [Halieaceae bacterium]|jgi:urease accessory protein|nr:urease accessory UreF family protein [Halieaceae bacterium]